MRQRPLRFNALDKGAEHKALHRALQPHLQEQEILREKEVLIASIGVKIRSLRSNFSSILPEEFDIDCYISELIEEISRRILRGLNDSERDNIFEILEKNPDIYARFALRDSREYPELSVRQLAQFSVEAYS